MPELPAIAQHHTSHLLLIDLQEKLANAMPQPAMANLLKQIQLVLTAAQGLSVPITVTEQYPQGLGATLPALNLPDGIKAIPKTNFSCASVPAFKQQLRRDRPQLVLIGLEAHICILQTALALQAQGWQIFVLEDGILSRQPSHVENALQRLRQAGVIVSTCESLVFEWLGRAEGDLFKQLSRMMR